jgi:glucan phosphoethanolaminetransferase (alkaline phosphatase superfamily)
MTDFSTVKKIGYRQAFKAVTVGLVIAYVIMALMAGPFWLFQFDYAPTILFAAFMIYVAGYFFGGLTGIWISKQSRLSILFGIIGGFLIVWTATFFGSLIGFMKEGLPNQSEISEPIQDYIYKPMALVTIFGFLPIILVGIWFGLSIKKKLTIL